MLGPARPHADAQLCSHHDQAIRPRSHWRLTACSVNSFFWPYQSSTLHLKDEFAVDRASVACCVVQVDGIREFVTAREVKAEL